MAYLDLENLRTVFLDDEALRVRRLQRQSCGSLQVTSGRIVACDPLVQPERPPFVRSVSGRGAFPAELLQHEGRHALAVLWLRDRRGLQPADLHWEPALLDGQSQNELGDDEFYGYPVDAGVGCFMDADCAAAIAEREARESSANPDYGSYYDDVLDEELGSKDMADHYPLGEGSANNVLIFSSGWGDGSYPSFWALDAAREPVALVTDFMTMQAAMRAARTTSETMPTWRACRPKGSRPSKPSEPRRSRATRPRSGLCSTAGSRGPTTSFRRSARPRSSARSA